MLTLLLLACAAPENPSYTVPSDTGGTTEVDTWDDGDGPCPRGMSQLGSLCIDQYEATLVDEVGHPLIDESGVGDVPEYGNPDQGADFPDGSTTARARPLAGQEPTVLITWYQAYAACQNAGKHLCTVEEWQTACGASVYPWGDEPAADTRCAVPDSNGNPIYSGLQPTGSLTDCRGAGDVYDQIGNAWEWADPGWLDADLTPQTAKLGGAWYAGAGNAICPAEPVTEHAPNFNGTIAARCCVEARE
jgi:formylglycine-generating enzyme required for sulfatase activity